MISGAEALSVDIARCSDDVDLPEYAHLGDAGLDLRSTIDATIDPNRRAIIPCGFSIAIPDGYAGLVLPRSGLSSKHGVTVVNAPGLIDSGYRGEVKVALINLDPSDSFSVKKGMRIAQLMIVEAPKVELREVAQLDITSRNSDGFGSSGYE